MKTLLSEHTEIKLVGALLSSMINIWGLLIFVIGVVVGHFSSPYIKSLYEQTKKRVKLYRESN